VVGTRPAAAQLGQNVRVDSATRGTRGVRSPAVVTWTDGFIAAPSPASDAMVRAAEGELRVHLPADFLAVAQVHQGAQPQPSRILLPNGVGTAVAGLLHFGDSPFVSNIAAAWFARQDGLEKGVIRFALDVGDDVFCFSYRKDYDRPPVVFWSVDWGAIPVAPSFTAFLDLLHGD
jgi:hypothetical protein